MNIQDPQGTGQESTGTIGTWRVTYVPGQWVALAGPDALVVMPPAPARAERFLTRLWESIVPTASIDDLVAELGRAGVTEMPDMAALFWDSGSMHSLVRGRLHILDAETGDVLADGEGVRTWSETGLGHVRSVMVAPVDDAPGDDDAMHLPLVVGAASVGSVLVETSPERLVNCPPAAPRGAVVEPGTPSGVEQPARPAAGAAAPGGDRGLLGGPGAGTGGGTARAESGAGSGVAGSGGTGPGAAGVGAGGAAVGAAGVAAAGAAAAAAVAGHGEQAAAGASGAGAAGASGAGAAGPGPAGAAGPAAGAAEEPWPHTGAVEAVSQGGGNAPHGQVYDPVHPESDEPRTAEMAAVPGPWDGHDRPEEQAPATGQPEDVRPEGQGAGPDAATQMMDLGPGEPQPEEPWQPPTGSRTEPERAPGPEPDHEPEPTPPAGQPGAGAPAAGQGPAGTAVLTPPTGPSGVSGTGTVGGEQQPAGQPSVMALLRPITGAPVLVDRPVLIGRAPNAQKAGLNVTPKLMTVPSPSHDISRTHVKVEPVGRTVQVTDLHSTNGTVLVTGPAGGDPSLAGQRHQLVPGEPVAVQPGWILDLGDGVTILIDRA